MSKLSRCGLGTYDILVRRRSEAFVDTIDNTYACPCSVGADNDRGDGEGEVTTCRNKRPVYGDLEEIIRGEQDGGLPEEQIVWLFRVPAHWYGRWHDSGRTERGENVIDAQCSGREWTHLFNAVSMSDTIRCSQFCSPCPKRVFDLLIEYCVDG